MNEANIAQLVAAITTLMNAAAERATYVARIKAEHADAHNGQVIAYQNALEIINFYRNQ